MIALECVGGPLDGEHVYLGTYRPTYVIKRRSRDYYALTTAFAADEYTTLDPRALWVAGVYTRNGDCLEWQGYR